MEYFIIYTLQELSGKQQMIVQPKKKYFFTLNNLFQKEININLVGF